MAKWISCSILQYKTIVYVPILTNSGFVGSSAHQMNLIVVHTSWQIPMQAQWYQLWHWSHFTQSTFLLVYFVSTHWPSLLIMQVFLAWGASGSKVTLDTDTAGKGEHQALIAIVFHNHSVLWYCGWVRETPHPSMYPPDVSHTSGMMWLGLRSKDSSSIILTHIMLIISPYASQQAQGGTNGL